MLYQSVNAFIDNEDEEFPSTSSQILSSRAFIPTSTDDFEVQATAQRFQERSRREREGNTEVPLELWMLRSPVCLYIAAKLYSD